MRNKPKTGVVFILIKPNKEMLLQLRDEKSPYDPNTWVFPGGAKEDDEDYFDAVLREAKEEYEVELKKENCELITVYNIADIVENNHVFMCNVLINQKIKINEGKDAKWMKIDEIEKLNLGYKQKLFINDIKKYLVAF